MDIRAEKLAKARKKLRDHQEKKVSGYGQETKNFSNDNLTMKTDTKTDQDQTDIKNGHQTDSFKDNEKVSEIKSDIITEMLMSNKTNLELQINEISSKLTHLESLYGLEVDSHNTCKQQNIALQSEISNLMKNYASAIQEVSNKNEEINELKITNKQLQEEKNNLFEQIELTKSMLTAKESENSQLHDQISSYGNKIDLLQLQLQQLTNDSVVTFDHNTKVPEEYMQKISSLEHKIQILQNDKEEISSHYQHYLHDLNEKLKSEVQRNEKLSIKSQDLYDREQSLIQHISEMEIRLQQYAAYHQNDLSKQKTDNELQKQYLSIKNELEEVKFNYYELQKQHMESLEKIKELTQACTQKTNDINTYKHDNVDITKLNADIASDKLAAQRATEQNEKLKSDIEGLEQVIIKMGKDKLELTEKWTHEKLLNKGLSLKLAEVEELVKNIQNQLKAKDDEMIRLLNEYREMEKKLHMVNRDIDEITQNPDLDNNRETQGEKNHDNDEEHEKALILTTSSQTNSKMKLENICIQQEDAMVKLQERFLNIMDEVANLSDEKHRLEHIILQLQNETDTICEYVALYQQQRNLLKKREEERSNQLKIFQTECDKVKRHLEELHNLLLRFAADKELASFLKDDSRYNDLTRVKELLQTLHNSSLINSKFNNLDINIFYPCNCCSGQLIDI